MIDQYLKPNVKRGAIYFAIVALVVGVLSAIPLLGCLILPFTCLTWLILPFAIGWLVAQWGRTMPATVTPLAVQSTSPYATPAVDGAVAAGAGYLVGGLIGWIIGLILSTLFAGLGVFTGSADAGAAVVGALGAGFGIINVIIGAIGSAICGAIGGALYVFINQNKNTSPTTPNTPPPPMQ